MNQEQVWREFSALPPTARQMVLDFIAFLSSKYSKEAETNLNGVSDLKSEPFFGMWRERSDMVDSTQWVRDIRQHEWG